VRTLYLTPHKLEILALTSRKPAHVAQCPGFDMVNRHAVAASGASFLLGSALPGSILRRFRMGSQGLAVFLTENSHYLVSVLYIFGRHMAYRLVRVHLVQFQVNKGAEPRWRASRKEQHFWRARTIRQKYL
jgi:hypothetical protein